MSRSGYSDACDNSWELICWRGAVASAIRGKRGQAFLLEMLAALDVLPEKQLAFGSFQKHGTCALGAVAKQRNLNTEDLELDDGDDTLDTRYVGQRFGIANAMAAEIMFVNDDWYHNETPEQRFNRVRAWVVGQINASSNKTS